MNHYGSQAMTHWQRWLPTRYAQISDPQAYFTELGEQVQNQVVELSTHLAAQDPAQDSYLDRVGRLNALRMQAEETVLAELVLLEPEPGIDPDQSPSPTSPQSSSDPQDPTSDWTPLIEDSTSPYWAQVREQETERDLTR